MNLEQLLGGGGQPPQPDKIPSLRENIKSYLNEAQQLVNSCELLLGGLPPGFLDLPINTVQQLMTIHGDYYQTHKMRQLGLEGGSGEVQ
jgi:hypothetical protein